LASGTKVVDRWRWRMASMDETTAREIAIVVKDSERALLVTALGLLISTLGREEADELEAAQALLVRIERAA
jgi:hypothetical protein